MNAEVSAVLCSERTKYCRNVGCMEVTGNFSLTLSIYAVVGQDLFQARLLGPKNEPRHEKTGFLAHLSRRLKGELIVYRAIRRPLVCASVSLCVR